VAARRHRLRHSGEKPRRGGVIERRVQIVVVAYHAAETLERTLGSLPPGASVTVVDNSQSDAVRGVCAVHSSRYLASSRNVGFAAGVNLALRDLLAGEACDVLLLNPDAELPEGALARLSAALHLDDRTCAVAPRLEHTSGSSQRVIWPFPSPRQAWVEAVGLGRLNRGVGFAVGAVLLLRWEALCEIGLLDERFFLYAEETDWQRRALERGWHSLVCEGVTATHAAGATSSDPSRREQLFYAAQELYVRKWFGARGWQLYRLANIVGAALRALILPRPRRGGAARRLLIYLRGPCRAAATRA
jgi:GT2 family glycosyltransferase